MDCPGIFKIVLASALVVSAPSARGWQPPAGSTQVEAPSSALEGTAQLRRMIDQGHAAEALNRLDQLKSQNSATPGVDRLRGLALYAQSRFSEADTAFANALKQDPRDEESTQMRGLTLFRLGRPAEAIPLLESAHNWTSQTKVDPSYVLAL